MRDADVFYDPTRYQWARNVIEMACELASLPAHPTKLYPSKIETPVDFSLAGLLDATTPGPSNFFANLFETRVIPEVLALCPLLVGVSVTYHFQLQPALTLTRLLKRAAPRLHVVVGGAIIYLLEASLRSYSEWFELADSFVVGEGETALTALAEEMMDDCGTRAIPNLIRLDGGKPKAFDTLHVERAEDLLCPDYDGLDLVRYLSPEPVLLVPSTRGCYYGKCAFCDVSGNTRRVYRPLARNAFVESIASLHSRHGARRFFIADDAVPPGNMRALAQLVQGELPDVTWQGEARFEKAMTTDFIEGIARGGCRQLSFGFEFEHPAHPQPNGQEERFGERPKDHRSLRRPWDRGEPPDIHRLPDRDTRGSTLDDQLPNRKPKAHRVIWVRRLRPLREHPSPPEPRTVQRALDLHACAASTAGVARICVRFRYVPGRGRRVGAGGARPSDPTLRDEGKLPRGRDGGAHPPVLLAL